MNLELLGPVLVSGLLLSSLYALMAVGLTLVWTTLGIFNFAHGAFMTLAAFIAWQVGVEQGWGLGAAAGFAAAMAALIGVGILIELTLVRPFINQRDRVLIVVMTTLAAMTIVQNGTLITFGGRFKQMPPLLEGNVSLLGGTVSEHELLIMIVAPVVVISLLLFLKYSTVGTAIRAVGQNPEAASLMGLNVRSLYATAFALSAALAAVAGILLGSIRFISPELGTEPLMKALIVAILGGLGSIMGTILGAYAIGFVEAFLIFFVGLYATPAILFALMIVVLLVRPEGLFGRLK
ncbi:MAG: branched-chain amino acid ABC transporter permease [Pseudomonadota bacterium]